MNDHTRERTRSRHCPAVLLALASLGPSTIFAQEIAPAPPDAPALCGGLRAERRVSYARQEPKLFRRIVELVESGPAQAPDAERVLRTFAACAETLRMRDEAGPLAEIRFEASPGGSSLVVVRGEDAKHSFLSRGDLVVLADRVARYVDRRVDERQRDDVRNRIWFLWIESYLKATGEKHNRYDYASELADERAEDRGLSFGVGFDVAARRDRVEIARIDDPRLSDAGLAEGDELLRIDDRELAALSDPELRRYWTSPTPFRFTISVRRNGDPVRIAGEAVSRRHRTVAWSARGTTGYVRIREFNQGSLTEVRRALRALDAEGIDRLILDLRGNPGGTLSPGLVDIFFKPGQTVLSCRSHDGEEVVDSDATVEYLAIPVALLVDRQSASMAEILVAAFRTHRRGPIVGEKTFGKSVAQTLFDVGDEGRLHLVTRTCYFPGTRETWNGVGIEPDVVVEIDDDRKARLAPFLDHEPLRLDEQWTLDPAWQAAERRLEETP